MVKYVELPKDKIKFESEQAKTIFDLSLENEKLFNQNKALQEALVLVKQKKNNDKARYRIKAKIYRKRIDKAIEYISNSYVEVLKYYDEPSETGSYELVTVDLLKILKGEE